MEQIEFKRPSDISNFFGDTLETRKFLDAAAKKLEKRFAGRDVIFASEVVEVLSECFGLTVCPARAFGSGFLMKGEL